MKMPLYIICTQGMRLYFKFMFRVEFEGVENIPKGGGYILASNHRHNFDPILLSLKLKKQIFYLAKMELFDTPIKNFLFSNIG
ncbi:MAG: lysophospholipid acyltransferase family protein, partial [Oscillospiraceae bacterium]